MEARRNDSAPNILGAKRMPNGKPEVQVVTPCLFLRPQVPISGPDDGIGFSARRPVEPILEQASQKLPPNEWPTHVFPAPKCLAGPPRCFLADWNYKARSTFLLSFCAHRPRKTSC